MEPILVEPVLIQSDSPTLAQGDAVLLPNEVRTNEFSDLQPEEADFGLLSGMNQNVNRASNQSGLDQLGNFLVNAGAEIAGGTIEGLGYLADFEQHKNLIKGTEEEFSNWFSDYGKQLKDATGEAFPIYEAKPGEFNPWDSGFWAKNGVSIASSLSLLIPARGITGLLSKIGKGLGAERLIAGSASLLGKEGEALQVAIRAAKQNTKGITAAILSRTMENTMEASGTFEEIYNTKLAEGYSEEDARNSAGEGARDVWYQNSVMLLQDIPQYMFLFKAPGLLKSEGKQLQKLMSITTLKDVGKQFVSEAGEEVYQSVVGQEAKAKQLQTGVYNQLSFEERLAQYLKEDEVLTSALFGGLGGAAVTVGGRAWENIVAKRYQNYEDMKLASSVGKDNLVQQVKDKQSIEVLANHLDDLDKVKTEVEEIAKEEGADKTQIQNVLSDIEVAEQTKNSLVGVIDDKYVPAATQLNVEANQAARRLNKTTDQLNSLKELDSVKAQLNKSGSQAFDYNVSVNALKQIDKLRKQYSKNPTAQTVLDELEKEHTQVVNDLAEYNKPISGITNQLNQHVNDLLVNEVEHRTKSKEFEEVSIGNTAVLDERVKGAEIEQLKAEKDIDKLLTIRDSEDVELSKVAKSRLKELYANEDKVIPENIEELPAFYEKNPLTFKANLKEYGLPKETTLEEFNTIVQTPEFQQQFEAKKQSQVQDVKVQVEEAKVIEQVEQPIKVEETPIASTDEQSDESNQASQVEADNTTIEDKKADIEKRRQEDLETTNSIGENEIIEGRKTTKLIVESLKQRYPATSTKGIIIRILEKLIDFDKYSTTIDSKYLKSKNASGQATWYGMIISQETLDGILAGKEHEVHTFIHEFIHGFTTSKLSDYNIVKKGLIPGFKSKLTQKEIKAIEQLQRIFDKVKRDNPKSKEYGLTNLDEFIAEAFSNEGFQATLKNTASEGKKSNLFSDFINAIGDLLFEQLERWAKRFNKEVPQRDTITGILEDVLAWTEDLIDQNNKLEHIGTVEEINAKYDAELNALNPVVVTESTKQQFDITNQEEQDDLVDTKEGEWTDTTPNRIKTTDAYVYYYDSKTETFNIPSMKDGKFSVEEFNEKYQVGKQEKGYHILYDKDGQVVFFPKSQEPTLDIDFLRNLSQVGDVYNEPVTLEVDRNYKNGTWTNQKQLEDDKNGWKTLKVAIKIQGKTIGFLADENRTSGDPFEQAQFVSLRKTLFNNTKSSTGIYEYPFKTTLKSINPPRFWQGPRTQDLISLQQSAQDGTKLPIILGLVKNGKLFLNNAPLSDKQKEELEGKFNLSDGAIYWLLTNPVTGDYVPYRLFTSKVKDNPKVQEDIKKLLSSITEQNWKEKRNELQELVRWKNDTGKYEPDFGYTKAGKFFVVKDGEKIYDITPDGVYDFYVNERGFNIIEDSSLQVEAEQLNQPQYNETLINQKYFTATLNAGLFHSPNFRINIEPLVENKTQVVKEVVPEEPSFSIKDNREVTKWNEQEETQWFKDKIGELIDLNIVDDSEMNSLVESLKYIHGKDNVEAWGFFHTASVWISKNAKSGTTQHEAFHVIFNLALTKTQQESLLNWGSKEYGIDRADKIIDKTPVDNNGVNFVFNKAPELYSIGTQKEYNEYLKTIFPNSKIKDIIYRSGKITDEEFENNGEPPTDFMDLGSGLYFSPSVDIAYTYGSPRAVKVNIQNFKERSIAEKERINYVDPSGWSIIPSLDEKGKYDGIVETTKPFNETTELVVFESSNVHILGSESDINSFRKWKYPNDKYYEQLSGDVQIEEKLADAFAEYVQMAQVDEAKLKQTPWHKQLGASVKRLFRKMYLAIKASVGLNLSQDEIFFRINSGAYKNNKRFKRNVDVFKPSIKAYADNLKQQDRLTLVQTYFNQKFVEFRDKKQKEGWKEQQILDAAIKPTLNGRLNEDNIYYQLSQMFNDTAQDRLSKGNQYQHDEYKEVALKLYDGDVVSDRIADKFGPLYNNALDNLKNYGIRVNRLQGDLDINDETQDTLENWMEVHPPSAYESMSKQIKVGLSSLMRGEYDGNNYVAERDDLGFPRFVDAFEVYSYLKDELSDSQSREDYMEKLGKLGEDIGWARRLHEILSGKLPSTIIVDIDWFKSELYQPFQEPTPDFKYLLQIIKDKKAGQYEWQFNNSASKSIATRLSVQWLSNINSPLYNKTVEAGKVDELKTQLGEYIKDNKDDNNWLYKALNDLGITLSKEAIESVTEAKKGNKRDFLDNFKKVVDNVGKDNFDELLSVKNSLIEMAKLVKKYYPEFHLPAFTNVEGETVQNYIRNSFMARQLNKFKSSKHRKELIDFYRTDKFYAPNDRTKEDTKTKIQVRDDSYSLWLDRIQNDAAYNKMTFAVLDGQKLAGETNGTPYSDLSPLEFNRMTLNAFYNKGNYKRESGVGKAYYSAQIMADSGSHAYIGFESYSQEHIINKLEMMAQNEYFAYLHNQVEGNKTGIKGYNPKLMFIPGLIENRNNLTPQQLQEKAIELVQNTTKLREAIKTNLDKIVKDTIEDLQEEGLIVGGPGRAVDASSIHLDYRIKDIPEFIKDFVYNDFFAQTQIISLFHGKLYQYKSMEDFYKRAKEIWSPGNFIDTSRTGVNQKFMTYFVDSDSTELNYRNNKESVDAIYNNILGASFSEDDAKKAASGYGYTDGTNDGKAVTLSDGKVIESGSVDATDAQGIIDIYRWREIMLGKGMESNEVERIFNAIINDTYTIDDLSRVMNPIKQFYYTLINVNGQVSGLQIKNSEYVLLPQIAKGNKQLEGILDFLKQSREKHLVNGSINYDSAVKVGLHKVNTSTEKLDLNNAIELDNNEYRIQGEVPEHQVDTTNLLGTQLRKLIVGDLNLEDIYEVNGDKVNGKELINEWNQLLIADIWHSSESLKKEFSNPVEFYKMLQDEARSRDYPDKFIEALTLVDGKPRLGLFHPLLTKKAQALISSVFRNRITKMKFNGMSTPNAALSNKKLSILYNSDGSIKAFEAELPLWSKSLVEGMDVVTTEELAKLGLDLGVAYRIPTEGKYSMIPIKIVGFTNAGITLPAEITKVAGLDYDIDKMYVMLYEFITKKGKPVKVEFQKEPNYTEYVESVKYSKDTRKLLKKEEVDVMSPDVEGFLVDKELLLTESQWSKLNVYQQNSQKARDNRKLDIIRSVLNNPKTIKAQLTPGGFDDLKVEANRIEDVKGDKLDKINPMTLISRVKIFARMMAGKKLIGIPANYNATHALMQHNNLELTKPVLFNGYEGKDLGLLEVMDGSKLVSNNFAQYLASVVDNGKDPLADKYNLNTYTADVAMLMAKFFPIETGMKFIAQPSIVEFYKEYVNQGANFKAEQKAIEKILGYSKGQYNKMMEDFVLENINDSELETGLKDNPRSGSQKKMLMHFLYYKNNQAKDLSKLVSAIKVPDSGASASIAKTVNNVAKVNDALKLDTIKGVKEFLNNENLANSSLYEKGIQDALKEFVKLGFPDYVKPNSAFVKVFEQLAELKGSILSEKEIGLVNDATYSFLSSAFEPIKNINTLEVIKNVPKLWAEFIKLNRKEYYALMGSIDSVASEHNEKELKLVLNNNQPKDVENKVMNQWEDLLKSSKPINSNYTEGDLGRMLTEYAFVTNGFRFTTGSLSHIQPISFYENLRDNYVDFNTFIEQQIDSANNDETFLSQFYDQFVRHYFPRLSYVKSIEKEDGGIRLDEKTKEPYSVIINDYQAKEYVKYRDTDTRKWYLFKMEFMDTESGTAYYNRVNPLGLYREVEEWNFELTQKNSLFLQNNMSKEVEELFDEYVEANPVEETIESFYRATDFDFDNLSEYIYLAPTSTGALDYGKNLFKADVDIKEVLNFEETSGISVIDNIISNDVEIKKTFDFLIDQGLPKNKIILLNKNIHKALIKQGYKGLFGENELIVFDKSIIKTTNKLVAESTANVEIDSSFEKKDMTIDFQEEPVQNITGINIFSGSNDPLGAALTNPTHYNPRGGTAKSKGMLVGKYLQLDGGIVFRDRKYKDVEEAYFSLRTSSGVNPENLELITLLEKAKLEQYPFLVDEIKQRGGVKFLESSIHSYSASDNPLTYKKNENGNLWTSNAGNYFLKTLIEAYKRVTGQNETNVITKPTGTQLNLFNDFKQSLPTKNCD